MTAQTSKQSGDWSDPNTWTSGVVPVNGDTVTIQNGHTVRFDVSQSSFANGLGLLTIAAGGILHTKASVDTYLKMNANIDVNGAFYVAEREVVSGFALVSGKQNTYSVVRSLLTYSVEEQLGQGYLEAWEELKETAIVAENSRRVSLGEDEMMPDEVQSYIESYKASLTVNDFINYVESVPGSFYQDMIGNVLYIHTSDSSNPSGKTITVIEPINRPTAGTESRCQIVFNSSGIISNTAGGSPVLQMFGWHPEREWDQLSADVANGATTLSALVTGLDVQQGDKISIGSGTEFGMSIESAKGIYTLSGYNSKVITISSGLGTARLINDYIFIFSRTIKIARSSGTTALFSATTYFNDIILHGVNIQVRLTGNTVYTNYNRRWKIKHSVLYKGSGNQQFVQSVIKDTFLCGDAGAYTKYFGMGCFDLAINRCTSMNSDVIAVYTAQGVQINNNISQNNLEPSTCLIKNSIMLNLGLPMDVADIENLKSLVNCIISGQSQESHVSMGYIKAIDCTFKDNTTGYFTNIYGELYNCIFEGTNEVVNIKTEEIRSQTQIIESFDHNQIKNNYKAWMRGGKIETQIVNSVVQPGKLIFKPESTEYPTFKDYIINAPANRTIKFLINLLKSIAGINVKLQIVDPSMDPLIDSSATPLREVTAANNTNEQQLGISYKSNTAKQLILRVLCQNSEGTVNIDVSRIEQMLQKRALI